jgi:hypothetical protein
LEIKQTENGADIPVQKNLEQHMPNTSVVKDESMELNFNNPAQNNEIISHAPKITKINFSDAQVE